MSWWLGGQGTPGGVRRKIEETTCPPNSPTCEAVRQLALDFIDSLRDNEDKTINGVTVNCSGHDGGPSACVQVELRPLRLLLPPAATPES